MDLSKFARDQYQPRTESVAVPELAEYGGEDCKWVVRGLTGAEFATVRAAVDKNKSLGALVEAISAGNKKETTEHLKDTLGLGCDGLPDEHVRQIEMLLIASVDPVVDRPTVVKMAAVFPIVITRLCGQILELTGLGQELGKQEDSGEKGASESL